MKITDLKVAVLQGNFEWMLIRVDTDEGLSGYGEAFAAWRTREWFKPIALGLKDALVGEDPTDVERLWAKMGPSPRSGPLVQVISGVEMALWDIAGKALGAPVYKLLGGKWRDSIRVYCDCHAGTPIASRTDYSVDKRENYTPQAYAENARRVKRLGFTFLKFDLYSNIASLGGRPRPGEGYLDDAAIKFLASLVEGAREAVGDNTDLAMDFGGYAVSDAIRLANALEPYHLVWVEDVVPQEYNAATFREVTRAVKTPTLTGELLYTRQGFRELIEQQAVRIVAPDLSYTGGLAEGKKIAELAGLYAMHAAPHNICSPIGTMAVVHACAAMPNLLALEFHAVAVPWWNDLVKGTQPLIQDGYIKVPDGPGIGVELNEDEAKKHLLPGETLFE
ncbi:MAG: mandelate racemase/muconate lactonizing enzyme family protein [Candidatus Bathyarchaeia archaeon]